MEEHDLIDEVLVKPRSAHVSFPGVQCIARPDWHQLTTPAMKDGGLNGISLAILEEATADQVIDDAIRGYEELGIKFRWTVGPDSRPLDLGQRLEARGLKAHQVAGMVSTRRAVPGTPEIEVDVVGPSELQEFNELMSEGYFAFPSSVFLIGAVVLPERCSSRRLLSSPIWDSKRFASSLPTLSDRACA